MERGHATPQSPTPGSPAGSKIRPPIEKAAKLPSANAGARQDSLNAEIKAVKRSELVRVTQAALDARLAQVASPRRVPGSPPGQRAGDS
jgi:hypothetical protein